MPYSPNKRVLDWWYFGTWVALTDLGISCETCAVLKRASLPLPQELVLSSSRKVILVIFDSIRKPHTGIVARIRPSLAP
jgi:hypothetical protein